jgi:hypothetical protein
MGEMKVIGRKVDVTQLMCQYKNTWYDVVKIDTLEKVAEIKNNHGSILVKIDEVDFYVENLDWKVQNV